MGSDETNNTTAVAFKWENLASGEALLAVEQQTLLEVCKRLKRSQIKHKKRLGQMMTGVSVTPMTDLCTSTVMASASKHCPRSE